jgi:uncharacterized membrane protein YccC
VVVAIAFGVAIIFLFAVLPATHDFPVVAAALGLFFLPVGAFIPTTQATGQLLATMTAMALSLQPEYDAQFGTVLDGALGTLAGLAALAGQTLWRSRMGVGGLRRPATPYARSAAMLSSRRAWISLAATRT